MANDLTHKEDELFAVLASGHFLNVEAFKRGVQLIRDSELLREYIKHDATPAALVRTANELNTQLQALSRGQPFIGAKPLISAEEGGTGLDTDAGAKFATGCGLVAAVALATGNVPMAVAFGLAGAIAQAVVEYAQ
jgi:hypothetical protein